MPVGYLIAEGEGLVYLRAWGGLTTGDLQWCAEHLSSDERFQPTMASIFDLSPVSTMLLSSTFFQRHRTIFAPTARRAWVVSGAEAYGLTRMYQLANNINQESLQIFKRVPEALAWLGLPEDSPWPAGFPAASSPPQEGSAG